MDPARRSESTLSARPRERAGRPDVNRHQAVDQFVGDAMREPPARARERAYHRFQGSLTTKPLQAKPRPQVFGQQARIRIHRRHIVFAHRDHYPEIRDRRQGVGELFEKTATVAPSAGIGREKFLELVEDRD